MSSSVLTVSQVNSYIKTLLDGDKALSNIFVSGEISNFNNHYKSGHLYFSLKDDRAVLKAVMFSSNAGRLRFLPEDGMKVIVCGRISLYEATGQYQLYVESMQPDGLGALALAYEQLKSRLQAEGLFDQNHKLPIPEIPSNVGVITSPTGAVLQDIKNVISRRYPLANLILCPVAVQGDNAAKQLKLAVRMFNSLRNADVIIIGRGGGSFEDLNCFNDEALVREIYSSSIPVISAVGHETDFTLCDFVSDLRAPTPSAAAELAVPDKTQLMQYIGKIYGSTEGLVQSKIDFEFQFLDNLTNKLSTTGFSRKIGEEKAVLLNLNDRIRTAFENRLRIEKMRIDGVSEKINNLSPISILKRGYSFTRKNGFSVASVEQLSVNDRITIEMSDGCAECTVDEITCYKRR